MHASFANSVTAPLFQGVSFLGGILGQYLKPLCKVWLILPTVKQLAHLPKIADQNNSVRFLYGRANYQPNGRNPDFDALVARVNKVLSDMGFMGDLTLVNRSYELLLEDSALVEFAMNGGVDSRGFHSCGWLYVNLTVQAGRMNDDCRTFFLRRELFALQHSLELKSLAGSLLLCAGNYFTNQRWMDIALVLRDAYLDWRALYDADNFAISTASHGELTAMVEWFQALYGLHAQQNAFAADFLEGYSSIGLCPSNLSRRALCLEELEKRQAAWLSLSA